MVADAPRLPDGLVAFVKRDCPTCELVTPVLAQLAEEGPIAVFSQDDPSFPAAPPAIDDRELTASWHADIEAVPTLLRVEGGVERERVLGWHRGEWETLSGVEGLGPSLPDERPGCGSLSVAPDRVDALRARFRSGALQARRIDLAPREDEFETMYERGWSTEAQAGQHAHAGLRATAPGLQKQCLPRPATAGVLSPQVCTVQI